MNNSTMTQAFKKYTNSKRVILTNDIAALSKTQLIETAAAYRFYSNQGVSNVVKECVKNYTDQYGEVDAFYNELNNLLTK